MASPDRPRIAVLGGGAAGMATAWRLSEPGWQDRFESITLYQRGWRLGGKGASSRGPNGRIEEHGLHVWLGYYENAFRTMRECYAELDRPSTDPSARIRTWLDAFRKASAVGLEELHAGEWKDWVAVFGENDQLPGEPDADSDPLTVGEFAWRAIKLLGDFYASLREAPQAGSGVILSSSPHPPKPSGAGPIDVRLLRSLSRQAIASALAGAAQLAGLAHAEHRVLSRDLPMIEPLGPLLRRAQDELRSIVVENDESRRLWFLADLLVTTLRGIVADGLLTDPRGFAAINGEEYRDWMARHGASPDTLESPLVRGVYDLVFGYQDGDPARPRFAAGLGLFLSAKIFFDYKGAIFWKMQAGMGEIVFAPMYQALRARGVDFEFFHRVDALRLDAAGRSVTTIELGRQIELADGVDRYEPLIEVGGLPCFPSLPLQEQLAVEGPPPTRDLEMLWTDWHDAGTTTLRKGADFDVVVFAISIGMVPYICGDLVAHDRRWRDMVDHIGTVATQAFQVWLRDDGAGARWSHDGMTMTGFVEPFDTWASMEHLLAVEEWPEDESPSTLGYFCNTLFTPDTPERTDTAYPHRERERVRRAAVDFLNSHASRFWPSAVDPTSGRFRWELLAGADGAVGEARFASQFWTANVDPSERYVQSLPGSDKYRLRADESGFDNLVIAGDWINTGLNAGCIEAAVMSGLQAANVVLGRPIDHRIAGHYLRMDPPGQAPRSSSAVAT